MATTTTSSSLSLDWDDDDTSLVLVHDQLMMDVVCLEDDALEDGILGDEKKSDAAGWSNSSNCSGWDEGSNTTTSGWEEISDVQSVMSLDTTTTTTFGLKPSYKDILAAAATTTAATAPSSHSWKIKTKQRNSNRTKRMTPIAEKIEKGDKEDDVDGLEFDSTFIMEGVKLSGGGKSRLRFKGNSRTPRPTRKTLKR